jgi:hypothetical protein
MEGKYVRNKGGYEPTRRENRGRRMRREYMNDFAHIIALFK